MNLYDLYTDALEKVAMDGGWKKEAELDKEAVVSTKDLIIPGAVGAATGLLISHKRKKAAAKKAEHSKEAFYAALGRAALGAGKLALKGGRRFMFGKKGSGVVKGAKTAYKRSGQIGTGMAIAGTVGSGVRALNQKVAPTTPPQSAAAAPGVNTPKPPSI